MAPDGRWPSRSLRSYDPLPTSSRSMMKSTSDLPPPYFISVGHDTTPSAPTSQTPIISTLFSSVLDQLSQSSKHAKAELKRKLKGVHRLGLWVTLTGCLLFAMEVLQLFVDSHFSALIGLYCGFLQILSGAFAITAYKRRNRSHVIVSLVFAVLACIATFIGVMVAGFGEIPMYYHGGGRYHRFSFLRACLTFIVCLLSFVLVIGFSGTLCRRSCCEKAQTSPHILPVIRVPEQQTDQLQRQLGQVRQNVVMVTASSGENATMGVLPAPPAYGFDGMALKDANQVKNLSFTDDI